MAEYIDRGDLTIWLNKKSCEFSMNDVAPIGWALKGLVNELATFPSADVVERKAGTNVATEYDDCDQFVCSECGIELQDWHRVERDEDDGDVTYHEYRFRFCPNCGAKMISEPPKEET